MLMNNLVIIILVFLFMHFVCDFILQEDDVARKKSTSNRILTLHCIIYIAPFIPITYLMLESWYKAVCFSAVTFIAHWITDYISSRVCKYYHETHNRHNFFVAIGFDQLAHQFQIILTLVWVIQL